MSIIKNSSLAPSGLRKIQWVRDFMPALSGIEERFRREKPFQGLTIAVSVHLEAKKLGLKSESVVVGRDSIKAALEKKQPVICSMKPGDFTTTGHFIVLTGLTEDGRLMINDPNSITRSEKRWDIDTIVGQVKSAWTYTVP